jgi:hypothetical protein
MPGKIREVTEKMVYETTFKLARGLDTRSDAEAESYWSQIRARLPAAIPQLIAVFPTIKKYQGRVRIIWGLMRFHNRNDVYALAIHALQDPSMVVRYRACQLLAFAQRRSAIPFLQALLDHKDQRTVGDARATIDAIVCHNKDYFIDRAHTGQIHMEFYPRP